MHSSGIAQIFELTVATSALVGLLLGRAWLSRGNSIFRLAKMAPEPPPAGRPAGWFARERSGAVRILAHPLVQFGVVCALLYVNQAVFGAWVLSGHGHEVAVARRAISPYWFQIAPQDPLVRLVAAHAGDGRWLAPSLLRVQAFLELPFTVFAYLSVAAMLGRSVLRALTRPLVVSLAAVSFSVVFSIVEVKLQNPWTSDDLALRALSCVVTPIYVVLLARASGLAREPQGANAPPDGPWGTLGLLSFLVGAGAVAYVVLAVYDFALLYNLAHLGGYARGLATAIPLAVAATWIAPRIDGWLSGVGRLHEASVGTSIVVVALRTFTVVFFVPSLSLRYASTHPSAVRLGLVLVALSIGAGLVRLRAEGARGRRGRYLIAAALSVLVGVTLGAVGAQGPAVVSELRMARFALSFLASAIVAFRMLEIALCSGSDHETKAQADEA